MHPQRADRPLERASQRTSATKLGGEGMALERSRVVHRGERLADVLRLGGDCHSGAIVQIKTVRQT
jgi:hypothetical protein